MTGERIKSLATTFFIHFV